MSDQITYPDYVWWLIQGKLAGMPKPPLEDLTRLDRAGMRGTVSVMDEPSGIEEYKQAGFEVLRLPTTGGKPPIEQVKQFVRFAKPLITEDRPVVVHCTSGNRRTGTLLAAYLIAEGETPEKAMQRGLGRGIQAPEINSGDSPLAFPHERLHQEAIALLQKARPTAELRDAQTEFLFSLPQLLKYSF